MNSTPGYEALKVVEALCTFDDWREELLSESLFGFVFDKVLSKTQRFMVEERVRLQSDGLSTAEAIAQIALILKINHKSVLRECRRIKTKFKNRMKGSGHVQKSERSVKIKKECEACEKNFYVIAADTNRTMCFSCQAAEFLEGLEGEPEDE